MAAVAASSCVRPACAAFAPPAAHKSPARAVSFACSSSVQLRDCSRLVRNGNRMTTLGLGVRGLRRGSVVRASVEDVEDNMDDEGVVRDMERYLNDLSVEYENVWDTKPVWCQPWTIVLTGVIGVSLSWLVIKSAIVTGIVTVLVAGWWYVFLYTYPLAYTAMIAERRQKQRNGTEDTYGLRTRK
ncbi:hypothetical protein M758_1G051300 [Ceratodon purpureus]|uniref:DUF6737 domain-containing protein n=1 Tax=Ceratodon purpureus TaxID=3225 RepID=A0A8T0J1Q9_CERPU|nr:hypothetical protein KC19_1G053900 [Ceratodon purpureus]KAG0628762.1 hypothetical protein M758_1G051300 [Ceratodon purpureus]